MSSRSRFTLKPLCFPAGIKLKFVVPAGTTNFSFIPAGKHKGFNVNRLRELMGWEKDECVYIGDALFLGGNDYVVVGVVPTRQVKDPQDTFLLVKAMLS